MLPEPDIEPVLKPQPKPPSRAMPAAATLMPVAGLPPVVVPTIDCGSAVRHVTPKVGSVIQKETPTTAILIEVMLGSVPSNDWYWTWYGPCSPVTLLPETRMPALPLAHPFVLTATFD